MKKLKFFGFSISIIFAFFLLLELILRTTHLFGARISWSKPNEEIGYKYSPNSFYWNNLENDHPISGYINKWGWRDKNWDLEKPKNHYRVAVLGDSFIEAFQVESDSTSLRIAETILKEKYFNVEIMNFGRSGMTTTEQLITLKNEVIKFSPDLVILFFLPSNDILDVSPELTTNLDRPFPSLNEGKLQINFDFKYSKSFTFKEKIHFFKTKSALISFLAERFNLLVNALQSKRNVNSVKAKEKFISNPEFAFMAGKDSPEMKKAFGLNKVLIKEIIEICKKKKIDFLLTTITKLYGQPKYKEVLNELRKNESFIPSFFDDELSKLCVADSVKYLNLTKVFENDFKANQKPLFSAHWNYRGNRIVGETIADEIILIMEGIK